MIAPPQVETHQTQRPSLFLLRELRYTSLYSCAWSAPDDYAMEDQQLWAGHYQVHHNLYKRGSIERMKKWII